MISSERSKLEDEIDNVKAKLQTIEKYKPCGVVSGAKTFNKTLLSSLNKKLIKHNERYANERNRK